MIGGSGCASILGRRPAYVVYPTDGCCKGSNLRTKPTPRLALVPLQTHARPQNAVFGLALDDRRPCTGWVAVHGCKELVLRIDTSILGTRPAQVASHRDCLSAYHGARNSVVECKSEEIPIAHCRSGWQGRAAMKGRAGEGGDASAGACSLLGPCAGICMFGSPA